MFIPKDVSEKDIQSAILKYLRMRGIFCWRQNNVGVYDQNKKRYIRPNSRFHLRGVSDILGVLPDGRLLAIEVKSRKGVVSIDQRTFLDSITQSKGVAFVARSLDDVIQELRYALGDGC